MNHSFEYIDIILLAMIAGFIFLRLRGILGRRTGHEENLDAKFSSNFQAEKILNSGCEKLIINNSFLKKSDLARTLIKEFGSSTVVCCVDVKKNFFGPSKYNCIKL